jgi:hypothetical protein
MHVRRLLFALLLLSPHVYAQCSISINTPMNNATVSGPTAITVSVTSCPTIARVEYRLNGGRLPGEGTWINSFSSTPPYSLTYNMSYEWDGTHQLTAQVVDYSGTVLATSAAVNVIVDQWTLATTPGNGLVLTAPDPTVTQSGTITVTATPNITPSNNPALQSIIGSSIISCYVDGVRIFSNQTNTIAAQSFSWDTTTVENGTHGLLCNMRLSDSISNTNLAEGPTHSVERQITISNGNHSRELRLNYGVAYLWLGGTTTVALVPRVANDDNTEASATATFTSGTPGVATVGSCIGVSSCTVTAVAAGTSIITATSGALTRTMRVVVQAGAPVAPQFTYNGQILTSYSPGNSQFFRTLFATDVAVQNNAPLWAAFKISGMNSFELGLYSSPADQGYPNLATWKVLQDALTTNPANAALTGTGYRSLVATCSSMISNGLNLQSSADGQFTTRINYALAQLANKIGMCLGPDEDYLPPPRIPGGGLIGATNGPSEIDVSSGTATVVWPQRTRNGTGGYRLDIVGSTNSCLNAANLNVGGTSGNFTYSTGCANGTYKPSGGTMTETGFTVLAYNEIPNCEASNGCQNVAPLNIQVPNSIVTDVVAALNASPNPVGFAHPLQGGASAATQSLYNGVVDGVRVSNFGSIYWASSLQPPAPHNKGTQNLIADADSAFWVQWPGMEQSHPISMESHGSGVWFQNGGVSYTLGSTTGNSFTTTTAFNPVPPVAAKIVVTGSSCNGNYDIATVNSGAHSFTVTQSPGCTGSGGSVLIGTGNAYFTPPVDVPKLAGMNGVQQTAIDWFIAGLPSVAAERIFAYDQTPQVRINYPSPRDQTMWKGGNCADGCQTGMNYNGNTPGADDRWNGMRNAYLTMKALEPQLLQPVCNAPDLGSPFHPAAKCAAAGTLVWVVSDHDGPSTVNFPSSLWSVYNSGLAAITRYQIVNGAFVVITNLAAGSTSDTFVAGNSEVDLWYFPKTSTPLINTATIGFNPASVGATKTAVRYSYVCDATTFVSNLDQQGAMTVFTSAASIAIDKRIGPLCYDYQYLDASNVPVGARSSVHVLD